MDEASKSVVLDYDEYQAMLRELTDFRSGDLVIQLKQDLKYCQNRTDRFERDAYQLEAKVEREKDAQEQLHKRDLKEVEDLMAIGYDILKEKLVTSIELVPGPEWWQLPAFIWRQKIVVLIKASVWEGGRPQRVPFKPGTVINWALMK